MTKKKSTPAPKENKIVINNLPTHVIKDLAATNRKLTQAEFIAKEANQRHVEAHEGWIRFINSVIAMSGHSIEKKYNVSIDEKKNEVVLIETT